MILAIDQGTTSTRAWILDQEARVIGQAQKELTQHYPKPGWVEHDPNEIWESCLQVCHQALAQAKITGQELVGLGLANQRETALVWDRKTGQPVGPAIVWQDRRCSELLKQLHQEGHEPEAQKRSGLLFDAYFSAGKWSWFIQQHPDLVRGLTQGGLCLGTVDSWLAYCLTGSHITDVTNASRTLLMNLESEQWDTWLLDLFGIPEESMPKIVPTSGELGLVQEIHFGKEIPLYAMVGDQQAALYGQGAHRSGMAKCTYGTGCFLLMNTGAVKSASQTRLLTTVAWKKSGQDTQFALEGSVFEGGSVVRWLRDGLGLIQNSAEVNDLAKTEADSGGLVLVPAFSGLGAPYWDGDARGVLCGLTAGSRAGHLAWAVLESIAHQVVDLVECMQKDSNTPMQELRVDGGAARSDILLQTQANLLGVPVTRGPTLESTVWGAARMIAEQVGWWSDDVQPTPAEPVRTFEPQLSRERREENRAQWRLSVERARLRA